MNKKVYFAGSIRGGRADAELYHALIDHINRTDRVLTEHIGSSAIHLLEQGKKDEAIYLEDTAWLRESDLVIAECTTPSLGVGYELAYAERFGKPCYILYRHSVTELSAMLRGDAYFQCFAYETKEEALEILDTILGSKER